MIKTIRHKLTIIFLVLLLAATSVTLDSSAQISPANPVSQLVLPAETQTIPFLWRGDSISRRWDPYSAMLVPVTLPGCPHRFYMQFDLGSAVSMFYGPSLQEIQNRYPEAVPHTGGLLTNASFTIGSMPVLAKEIGIKQYGSSNINWQDSAGAFIIGTIGTDMFDGRFLLIDYPGKKIITGAEIPSSLIKNIPLVDMTYVSGRILLPATLRGKPQLLYFDTGSSAFGLMTDKATSEQLSVPGQVPVAFGVNSWGKLLSAFTLPTNDSIRIASQQIPLRETTYVEGVSASVVQQMMRMGISGLTGNKLFLGSVLLLDLKGKKFGISR